MEAHEAPDTSSSAPNITTSEEMANFIVEHGTVAYRYRRAFERVVRQCVELHSIASKDGKEDVPELDIEPPKI